MESGGGRRSLSLRKNFLWTLGGDTVYAGCLWGVLILLAKLGDPEMVGQFALALAVCAPVFMFANLQLRAVQATDARHKYLFSDYMGLRIITTLLALLLIGGITRVAGFRGETALVILGVALAKGVESISDVFFGLLQKHERMDRIAKSRMIKGPLSLAALGAAVYLTGEVFWGVLGLVLVWSLVLLIYDMRSGALVLQGADRERSQLSLQDDCWARSRRPRWSTGRMKRLLLLALPLGLVMMLISLNTNIPRYFIERFFGEAELGIFAALAYFIVGERMIINALGQSATPRMARYYSEGNGSAFKKLLFKLMGIGVLFGLLGILLALLAGGRILAFIYTPEYGGQAQLFTWLMVVATLGNVASFLGYGMTAARYFKAQLPLFTLVVLTSLFSCLWLIPAHGLKGAAVALGLALIVQLVGSSMVLRHAGGRLKIIRDGV